MGYLYLFAGLMCGVTKGYCGKRMSSKVQKLRDILLVNSVRMILCVLIGLAALLVADGAATLGMSGSAILIAFMSGTANAIAVVSWIIAVRRGAYMLPDVFGTLGLIVPIALSALLFHEQVTLQQCGGFALLLVAVYIMCSYNNTIKNKLDGKTLLALLLNGVSGGLTSFSQKLYVRYTTEGSILAFNFYAYVFSAIVLLICYFAMKPKEEQEPFQLKSVGVYIAVMSVCLFMNSYFLTLAAQHLNAVVLYPLNTGMSLVLSSLLSAIFFKEKITFKSVTGILLTFTALLIINVL